MSGHRSVGVDGDGRCLIVVAWAETATFTREVAKLRAALSESYGSYRSLLSQFSCLTQGAAPGEDQ